MTSRDVIRRLLVEKDFTLIALARKADIPYQTMKGYSAKSEKARRTPPIYHLIAICKALDVSLDLFRECEDLQNLRDSNPNPESTSE